MNKCVSGLSTNSSNNNYYYILITYVIYDTVCLPFNSVFNVSKLLRVDNLIELSETLPVATVTEVNTSDISMNTSQSLTPICATSDCVSARLCL
jgi:hypothetical protein